MFERIFKLSEHKTTVKTEVMAGITTFMTMAYILAVNPSVLGSTGMDTTAVLLATALASCLGTLCMAFMANLPFALSAGMGLNAFMAYTVVAGYGYSWQVALLAGNPRWARVVGYALHANPDPEGIPCYRVVTKDGRTSPAFAFGGADIQRALLEADGIEFTEDGRVDMAKYGWTGLG